MKIQINSDWSGNKDYGLDIDSNTDFFAYKDNFKKLEGVGLIKIFDNFKEDGECEYAIVIPTYKRIDTLDVCIDSAIHQNTSLKYRIVVLDNNPERDDATEKFMSKYKDGENLGYFKEEKNIGAFNNMNRAIAGFDSPWVIIIHDDDILMPDYLEEMNKARLKYPEYDFFAPLFTILDERRIEKPRITLEYLFTHLKPILGRFKWRVKKCFGDFFKWMEISLFCRHKDVQRLSPQDFIPRTCAMPTGTLYNREAFIRSGGYNDEFGPASDYVFFSRLSSTDRVMQVMKKLFVYRFAENETFKGLTPINTRIVNHYLSTFLMRNYTDYPLSIRDRYEKHRLLRDFDWKEEGIANVMPQDEFIYYKKVKASRAIYNKINNRLMRKRYFSSL